MARLRVLIVAMLCIVAGAAALYLLVFGAAIFCCSPIPRGAGFWRAERFFHGVLPMAAATGVLAAVLRRWGCLFARRRNTWVVGLLVAPLIAVLDGAVLQRIRWSNDSDIALAWNPEAGEFSWGPGRVTIPRGYRHMRQTGIDTMVGSFTSPHTAATIDYDIGELAGEHGGMGRAEIAVKGSRVRVGRVRYVDDRGATTYLARAAFIDAGCAMISISSADERDVAAIDSIAASFRPTGSVPGWLAPLLPEVLRTDCRYRFKLPEDVQARIRRVLDAVL